MPARKLESEGSPNDVSRSEKSLQDDQERNGMHTADKTSLVAFVTGATGISSVHLIQQLAKDGRFQKIYACSRRPLYDVGKEVIHVKADLLKMKDLQEAMREKGIKDVTHLYQNSFANTGDNLSDTEVNVGMHKNIIEALEAARNPLQHVYFNAGGKWYGQSVGVMKTPAHEDDPRPMPPASFYHDMQDYCQNRVDHGAEWSWSSLRPNPVAGFSRGSFMNITMSIATYACICKELRIQMRFPGSMTSWNAVNDVCDADLLAEAAIHCSTTPECANQAFNINNGDTFRWSELWPKLAAFFGLEAGPPMPLVACRLPAMMKDKGPIWDRLVQSCVLVLQRHDLEKHSYEEISTWEFMDFVVNQPCDWFQNCNKLKRTGFHKMMIDTDEMYYRQFKELQKRRIIPKYLRAPKSARGGSVACLCCTEDDDCIAPAETGHLY